MNDLPSEKNEILAVLRHREELFKQFVLNAPAPIAMVDKDMRYLLVSRRWITDYNLPESSIIGKSHYELFPEIPERWKAHHQRALKGEILKCDEDIFHRADGSVSWLRWELRPWHEANGEIGGITLYSEVITDRKNAEEALKRSNADLAQFASIVSHDLQEPLRVIRSYTQLFERKYRAIVDSEGQQYLDFISDSAKKMGHLITGILNYSQLGHKSFRIDSCDASKVLAEVIGEMELLIKERNASLTYQPLPKVLINEIHLKMVFQNLIANAIKYNNSSAPRIDIRAEVTDGETKFSVQDNGIGIGPYHTERIFLMFQRLHSPALFPGNGIGLASCKKIIEESGGKIWVVSEPGNGSTFFFTLRRDPADLEYRVVGV